MLVLWLLPTRGIAQEGDKRPEEPRPARYTLTFKAKSGESFSVFIDGNLQNRMPQSVVIVGDVSNQNHEVVVVTKRPAQKAGVLRMRPSEPSVRVDVSYDEREDQLLLYTPSHNLSSFYEEERRPLTAQRPPLNVRPVTDELAKPVPLVEDINKPRRGVSDDEMATLLLRMKSETFDSDRLAAGKVIVASNALTANQIAQLAQTIDFSATQVEFLKYAYVYCVDPANYQRAVDVLTFSSDKKKVMDYIATQR
jgi:hypothetical protein